MASVNENQADTTQVTPPPLGRTGSESVRVRKEQQGAVQFCARLGRTPTETQDLLNSAYQQDSLRKSVTKTYHKRFENLGVDVYKSSPNKAKKAKSSGDKKIKTEENGKTNKTDNGEQEKMNVEESEENNASNNGEGEHQPQAESDPKEDKEDSSEKTEQSSDSPQVNKASEEGSTEKAEGSAEA